MPGQAAEARVLAVLRAEPGLGVRELASKIPHALPTVTAAVKQLEEDWAIVSRWDRNRKRLFATGLLRAPRQLHPQLDELRNLIQRHGQMLLRDMVRQVEGPRSTTQHRLHRLAKLGEIRLTRTKDGLLAEPGKTL